MRFAKAARTGGFLLPVLALAALLAFSGCGGGDDSPESAGTGTAEADGNATKQAKGAKGQGAQPDGKSPDGKQSSNVPQPKGEPEPGITPEQRRKATTADVKLESPAFTAGAVIPTTYTCDGKDESPPLKWSGLPPEAAELVLLVMNLSPVKETLFFDWAVAGLDPGLEEIEEGKLPPGAVEGEGSFGKRGYSLCPPDAGKGETYIFALYAIPEALSPEAGFDPLELREAVLDQHGNAGLLAASYKR